MIKKLCDKIDHSVKKERVFLIFLVIWLLMNVLQSFFTQLHPDEAYYWMYSRNLDWGYFDHPPMVAIFVKIGYAIFHNELGVRLLHCLLGAGTLYILFKIIEDHLKSVSLLIIILSSIVIIHSHIGSFLAIPDTPVVFFTSLFLLVYKKYLQNDNWKYALLLGIIASAMLYSKYHGVLIVFFTLVSNLKILKRYSVWIIPATMLVLLLPHLFWQFENNFPTFQYHLVSRSSLYRFKYTSDYFLEQLVMSGPFIGFIIIYQAVRPLVIKDDFMRGLKFNFIGFIGFFFFMSFKGRVEPHWTALGYLPGVILATIRIQDKEQVIKWVRGLFLPTLAIFLILRFSLMVQIFPKEFNITKDFHLWDKWAKEIKTYANGRKVVFVNSFQQPSKYSFYTGGDFSHSLNSIHYRQNQYDIWNGEENIQEQDILLVGAYRKYDTLLTSVGSYRVRNIDNFHSYFNAIKIVSDRQEVICLPKDSLLLRLQIINQTKDTVSFQSSDVRFSPCISSTFHNNRSFGATICSDTIQTSLLPFAEFRTDVLITAPDKPGKYFGYLSLINDQLLAPFHSRPIRIIVTE
jgi:hypothetical protein